MRITLDLPDVYFIISDLRDAAFEFEDRFIQPEAAARFTMLADQIEAQA